jgi:hypothetical protein
MHIKKIQDFLLYDITVEVSLTHYELHSVLVTKTQKLAVCYF